VIVPEEELLCMGLVIIHELCSAVRQEILGQDRKLALWTSVWRKNYFKYLTNFIPAGRQIKVTGCVKTGHFIKLEVFRTQ
jgi:hypothetical protein